MNLSPGLGPSAVDMEYRRASQGKKKNKSHLLFRFNFLKIIYN